MKWLNCKDDMNLTESVRKGVGLTSSSIQNTIFKNRKGELILNDGIHEKDVGLLVII
jgi:hypothetical protein